MSTDISVSSEEFTSHDPQVVDEKKLAGHLQEMEKLLQLNDMSVLDRINEISSLIPDKNLSDVLIRQIRRLDYAGSLQSIAAIYETYGIPR